MPPIRLLLAALFALLVATPCLAANPAKVQTTFVSGQVSNSCAVAGALTFGSAPTPGDLILMWFWTGSTSVSINTTSWGTEYNSGGAGNTVLHVLYRYAQAGDTAALPAICTSGSPFWAANAIEVSGVSGTIGTDIEQTDTLNSQLTTSLATTSITTTHANDLVLIGAANYSASANITGASGFTFDVQQFNHSDYGAWAQVEKTVASSGTSVSTTFTIPNSANTSGYWTAVIRPASAPAAGKLLFHVFP